MGEGRGCLETEWDYPAQSLDPPSPPPQGFFVSVFYCFLNSEVRTLGWGSEWQETCWEERWSVASLCPSHAGPPPCPQVPLGIPCRVRTACPRCSCHGKPTPLLP